MIIIIVIVVAVVLLIIIIVPVCVTHSKETKEIIDSANPKSAIPKTTGGKKAEEFSRKEAIGLTTSLAVILVVGIILIIVGGVNYIIVKDLLTSTSKY